MILQLFTDRRKRQMRPVVPLPVVEIGGKARYINTIVC